MMQHKLRIADAVGCSSVASCVVWAVGFAEEASTVEMAPLPIIKRRTAREREKLLTAMYAGELPRTALGGVSQKRSRRSPNRIVDRYVVWAVESDQRLWQGHGGNSGGKLRIGAPWVA